MSKVLHQKLLWLLQSFIHWKSLLPFHKPLLIQDMTQFQVGVNMVFTHFPFIFLSLKKNIIVTINLAAQKERKLGDVGRADTKGIQLN